MIIFDHLWLTLFKSIMKMTITMVMKAIPLKYKYAFKEIS